MAARAAAAEPSDPFVALMDKLAKEALAAFAQDTSNPVLKAALMTARSKLDAAKAREDVTHAREDVTHAREDVAEARERVDNLDLLVTTAQQALGVAVSAEERKQAAAELEELKAKQAAAEAKLKVAKADQAAAEAKLKEAKADQATAEAKQAAAEAKLKEAEAEQVAEAKLAAKVEQARLTAAGGSRRKRKATRGNSRMTMCLATRPSMISNQSPSGISPARQLVEPFWGVFFTLQLILLFAQVEPRQFTALEESLVDSVTRGAAETVLNVTLAPVPELLGAGIFTNSLEHMRRFTIGSDLFLNREDSIAAIVAIGVQNRRAAESDTPDIRDYKTACLFHTFGAGKTTMIRKMFSKIGRVEEILGGNLSEDEKANLRKPVLTIILKLTDKEYWKDCLSSALQALVSKGVISCPFAITAENIKSIMRFFLENQPVVLAFDEIGHIDNNLENVDRAYAKIKFLRKDVSLALGPLALKHPLFVVLSGALSPAVAEKTLAQAITTSATQVKLVHLEPLTKEHAREIYTETLQRLTSNGCWPIDGRFTLPLPLPPVNLPDDLLDDFCGSVQQLCGGIPRLIHRMVLIALVLHNCRDGTLRWTDVATMNADLAGIALWYSRVYSDDILRVEDSLAETYATMVFCDVMKKELDSSKKPVASFLRYQAFLPVVQTAVPGRRGFVTLTTAPIMSWGIVRNVMKNIARAPFGGIIFENAAQAGEDAMVTALQLRALPSLLVHKTFLGMVPTALSPHQLMPWLKTASVPDFDVPAVLSLRHKPQIAAADWQGLLDELDVGGTILRPPAQSPMAVDLFVFFKASDGTTLLVELQRKTNAQVISERVLADEVDKSVLVVHGKSKTPHVFVMVADNKNLLFEDKKVLVYPTGQALQLDSKTRESYTGPEGVTAIVLARKTVGKWLPNLESANLALGDLFIRSA